MPLHIHTYKEAQFNIVIISHDVTKHKCIIGTPLRTKCVHKQAQFDTYYVLQLEPNLSTHNRIC